MPAKALPVNMPDVARCPSSLKQIIPFLQRAKEVQGKSPVVAYWCLYNSARLGLPLSRGKDNDAKNYVELILKYLEASKIALQDDPAISDTDMACSRIQAFAGNIFENADTEDRLGMADKDTAKKFLAASYFMQLLAIFDREDDVGDKIRYAKWKAADISKALREGRVPQSGPAGSEQEAIFDEGFPGAGGVPDSVSFPVAPGSSTLSPPAGVPPNSISPSAWSTVATPGPDYAEERLQETLWPNDSPTPTGKSSRDPSAFPQEGSDARLGSDDTSDDDRGYWSTASTPGVGIVDGHSMFTKQQGVAGVKLPPQPPTTSTNSYNAFSNYSDAPKGLAKQAPGIRRVHFTESTTGGSEDLNEPPPPSPVVELRQEHAELGSPVSTNGVQFPAPSVHQPGNGRSVSRHVEGLPSVVESANMSPDPSVIRSGGSPPRDNGVGSSRNGSAYPSPIASSQYPSAKPDNALPPTVPSVPRERKTSLLGGRSAPTATGPSFDDRRDGGHNLPPTVSSTAPGRDRSNSVNIPTGASVPRDKRDSGPPTIVPPGRERRNSVTRRDGSVTPQDLLPPTVAPPSGSQRERRNSLTGRDGPPTIASVSRGRTGSVSGQAPDGTRYLAPTTSTVLPQAPTITSKQSSPAQPAHMPLPSPSGSTNASANTSPDPSSTPLPASSVRIGPQAPGWNQGLPAVRATQATPYAPPTSGHPPAVPPPPSALPSIPGVASSGPVPPKPSTASSIPAPIASAPPAPSVTSSPQPSAPLDPVVVAQAQKHAKFAISALNYDDLPTARKELLAALALISG